MTPDLARRLARAYPSLHADATGVVGVAGVATVARYARKPPQLRPLRPPHAKSGKRENEGVGPVAAAFDAVSDAIEERRAIIADTCPAPYADAFARINHQKPHSVSAEQWERAVNDAGLFLDAWGALAAEMRWTAGDLFDVPREGGAGGLIWQLWGKRVEALGSDHVRLADGRIFERTNDGGR